MLVAETGLGFTRGCATQMSQFSKVLTFNLNQIAEIEFLSCNRALSFGFNVPNASPAILPIPTS